MALVVALLGIASLVGFGMWLFAMNESLQEIGNCLGRIDLTLHRERIDRIQREANQQPTNTTPGD